MGAVLVAILLLSVLALPLLGPVQGQPQTPTPPRHDLALTDIDVTQAPARTAGEVQNGVVRVVVDNQGDAPLSYRIHYTWEADGSTMHLNGELEKSFNVSSTPLWPNDSPRVMDFPWRLQSAQSGPGTVTAVVEAEDDRVRDSDPSDDARGTPTFVAERSMDLSVSGPALHLSPDGTGFFRVHVENKGNVDSDITLQTDAVDPDARLDAFLDPGTLRVDPGSSAVATLYIHYAPAGDDTPLTTQYDVVADPGFGDPQVVGTANVSNDGPEGLDGFAFDATGPAGEVDVPPEGLTRRVPITVHNTGQRADNYTFGVTKDTGWTASVSPPRIALFPGEDAEVFLEMSAPDALPGATGTASVDIRGSLLPTPQQLTVHGRVRGPAPDVEDVVIVGTPYVGDAPQVNVTVTNHGDEALDPGAEVLLDVTMPIPTGEVHLQQEITSPLGLGASRTFSFTLPPPTGGGTLRATAHLGVEGLAPTPQRSAEALVHAPALTIQAPPPATGVPGETVAYRLAPGAFQVTNTGNAAETLELEVHAARGHAVVEGQTVLALAPGQTRTIGVLHTLPLPAGTATSDGLILSASVQARTESWNTSVATIINDIEPPTLDVPALPDVWDVNSGLPLKARAVDDGAVAAVSAAFTDDDGNTTTVPLSRGEGNNWSAAASFSHPGNISASFHAVDVAGNEATVAAGRLMVSPIPPPQLRLVEEAVNNITNVTQDTILEVEVEDERPIMEVTLTATQQGEVLIRRTLHLDDGIASFNLSGLGPGPAEVVVTARNDAGAQSTLPMEVLMVETDPTHTQEDGLPASRDSPSPEAAVVALALLAAAMAVRRRGGEDA